MLQGSKEDSQIYCDNIMCFSGMMDFHCRVVTAEKPKYNSSSGGGAWLGDVWNGRDAECRRSACSEFSHRTTVWQQWWSCRRCYICPQCRPTSSCAE